MMSRSMTPVQYISAEATAAPTAASISTRPAAPIAAAMIPPNCAGHQPREHGPQALGQTALQQEDRHQAGRKGNPTGDGGGPDRAKGGDHGNEQQDYRSKHRRRHQKRNERPVLADQLGRGQAHQKRADAADEEKSQDRCSPGKVASENDD